MPERYVAIVPDRHGTGTNALVLAPPDAIAPPSARAAAPATSPPPATAGIPFAVEELPSLALDLDTPADVVALTRRAGEGQRRRPPHREGAGI